MKNTRNVLERLSGLNRELLREDDMPRVLKRLMETAMELAGAESGFLVLKSETTEGPIPGYSIPVACNIEKDSLETTEYAFSLSAVREAMKTAEPVVTDNALQDARFRDAKSVQFRGLKSILALPIKGSRGVLGVFYLDHRFEEGLFGNDLLSALTAFADIAALALQKGRMIEELRLANQQLSQEVAIERGQVELLGREVAESRIILKNEYSEIVGRSPKMLKVLSLVDRITESRVPVWIFGESGTGKEAVARALHFNSSRAKRPFVSENCSALPESLLESELFGHKKGAFTHAVSDKKGIVQYADGGTIFLDEIADMSPALQAKLLRFLQEGEIRPIGSPEVFKVDVRVISASNRDIQELTSQGKFREDLFFRLNGVTVALPPLRERLEDLPLLSEHFLKKIAEREKKKPCRLDPAALRLLMNHPWPGNIRELQNTLETAVLFAMEGVISPQSFQFKPTLGAGKRLVAPPAVRTAAAAAEPEMERILLAIRDQGYHKGNAAKALGISRRNLYLKLDHYKIPKELKHLKAFIDRHLP